MNDPQLQSANMLEEVEFYRALFELYEGGVVCPNTQVYWIALLTIRSSCIKDWLSLWVSLIIPIPRRWQTSQVREIDHDEKIAKVIRADVNYITSPR